MQIKHRHRWDLSPTDAIALQTRLAERSRNAGLPPGFSSIRTILGADVSYSRRTGRCYAAVIVLDFPSLTPLEERTAYGKAAYPYVPGLLSFREVPALVVAMRKVRTAPDVIVCDGQGMAHMRRFGLASHLGWIYDTPSIGCAKSRLVGEYKEPASERGAWSDLTERGDKIGEVVRTRDGVKPLFVSPGHRMTFGLARRLILACGAGRRLPEPTRLAHQSTAKLYSTMD